MYWELTPVSWQCWVGSDPEPQRRIAQWGYWRRGWRCRSDCHLPPPSYPSPPDHGMMWTQWRHPGACLNNMKVIWKHEHRLYQNISVTDRFKRRFYEDCSFVEPAQNASSNSQLQTKGAAFWLYELERYGAVHYDAPLQWTLLINEYKRHISQERYRSLFFKMYHSAISTGHGSVSLV